MRSKATSPMVLSTVHERRDSAALPRRTPVAFGGSVGSQADGTAKGPESDPLTLHSLSQRVHRPLCLVEPVTICSCPAAVIRKRSSPSAHISTLPCGVSIHRKG